MGGGDDDDSPPRRMANMEMEKDVIGRRDQLEDNAFDISLLSKAEGGGQWTAAWDDEHPGRRGA